MEHVQHPLLLCTKGPGLTAVQGCAQDTGSIDLDLGICRQLLIKPYSLYESTEHGSCFANAFIQLNTNMPMQNIHTMPDLHESFVLLLHFSSLILRFPLN